MKALVIVVGILPARWAHLDRRTLAALSPDQGTVRPTAAGVVVALVALATAAAAVAMRRIAIEGSRSSTVATFRSAFGLLPPHSRAIGVRRTRAAHDLVGATVPMFMRIAVHKDGRGIVGPALLDIVPPTVSARRQSAQRSLPLTRNSRRAGLLVARGGRLTLRLVSRRVIGWSGPARSAARDAGDGSAITALACVAALQGSITPFGQPTCRRVLLGQ
jgi:hypothetical protein